jgi:hypothetical protein
MSQDPHAVLGVSRDASSEEIRRAYKRLARRHHPDLNPHRKDAAERFREIVEAYDRIQGGGGAPRQRTTPRPQARPTSTRGATGRPRQSSGAPRRAERRAGFDQHVSQLLANDPAWIVAAHIRGVVAMQWSAIPAALIIASYSGLDDGSANPLLLLVGLPAAAAAGWLARRGLLVLLNAIEPWTELGAFAKDLVTVVGSVAAALGVLAVIAGTPIEIRPQLSGMVGAMTGAYLCARTSLDKPDDPWLWALASSALLGLPAAVIAAAMVLFFTQPRLADELASPFVHGEAALAGAAIAGFAAAVYAQRPRRAGKALMTQRDSRSR